MEAVKRLRGSRLKEIVNSNQGTVFCFEEENTRKVYLLNCQDFHRESDAKGGYVAAVVPGEEGLRIYFGISDCLCVKSGHLVMPEGATFDIETKEGVKIKEREIYLRDGI
jgi:hypothetical protein